MILSPKSSAFLFRQLAIGVRGGLAPVDVLDALAADAALMAEGPAPAALLAGALRKQPLLSAALASLPEAFAPELAALVQEGERTGRLTAVLDALARDLAGAADAHAVLRAVTRWPLILMVLYAILLAMILVFAIPPFKDLYAGFGVALPGPTLVLVWISDFFVATWWAWLIGVLLVYAAHRAGRLPPGLRAAWVRAGFRIAAVRDYRAGRIGARLATWLTVAHDQPALLAAAVRWVGAEARWSPLAESAAVFEAQLAAGRSAEEALAAAPLAPPYLAPLLRLARRLPEPAPALEYLGELAADQAAADLERFARAVVLASYLFIGASLGFIVIAVYLPIFKMGSVV